MECGKKNPGTVQKTNDTTEKKCTATAEERLERGDGRRGGLDDGVLLAAHLEHLAVGVGVQAADKRGTTCRPVLRKEAARLVADAAGVAQRLGALGAGAPLGRLLDAAVAAAAVTWDGQGSGGARELRRWMVLWLAPALLGLVLAVLAMLGLIGARRFVEEVSGGEGGGVQQEEGR